MTDRVVVDRRDVNAYGGHLIEQLSYHVRGWVTVRCLSHGHEDLRGTQHSAAARARQHAAACEQRHARDSRWERRELRPYAELRPVLVGKTVFGITAWRIPGDEIKHLAWNGPGDHVHMLRHGRGTGMQEFLGRDDGAVSSACQTIEAAQAAVDAWAAQNMTDRSA